MAIGPPPPVYTPSFANTGFSSTPGGSAGYASSVAQLGQSQVVRFEPSHSYPSDPQYLRPLSNKDLLTKISEDQDGLDSLMAARALSSRALKAYYQQVEAQGGLETKETLALALMSKNLLLAHMHFEHSQKLNVHAEGDTNHEAMLREMMAAAGLGGQNVLPPHQPAAPDFEDVRRDL